jgi:hypothetical protein
MTCAPCSACSQLTTTHPDRMTGTWAHLRARPARGAQAFHLAGQLPAGASSAGPPRPGILVPGLYCHSDGTSSAAQVHATSQGRGTAASASTVEQSSRSASPTLKRAPQATLPIGSHALCAASKGPYTTGHQVVRAWLTTAQMMFTAASLQHLLKGQKVFSSRHMLVLGLRLVMGYCSMRGARTQHKMPCPGAHNWAPLVCAVDRRHPQSPRWLARGQSVQI